ncbi:MAG TPA: hypothetical protein VFJ09_05390 [Nocardioidaceae bacterium]|nr:hypothetical protein [Nocardioidaceae bacterium]
MGKARTLFRVVLPQAMRSIVPPTGSRSIVPPTGSRSINMVLATSLVSFIAGPGQISSKRLSARRIHNRLELICACPRAWRMNRLRGPHGRARRRKPVRNRRPAEDSRRHRARR